MRLVLAILALCVALPVSASAQTDAPRTFTTSGPSLGLYSRIGLGVSSLRATLANSDQDESLGVNPVGFELAFDVGLRLRTWHALGFVLRMAYGGTPSFSGDDLGADYDVLFSRKLFGLAYTRHFARPHAPHVQVSVGLARGSYAPTDDVYGFAGAGVFVGLATGYERPVGDRGVRLGAELFARVERYGSVGENERLGGMSFGLTFTVSHSRVGIVRRAPETETRSLDGEPSDHAPAVAVDMTSDLRSTEASTEPAIEAPRARTVQTRAARSTTRRGADASRVTRARASSNQRPARPVRSTRG